MKEKVLHQSSIKILNDNILYMLRITGSKKPLDPLSTAG
jgi:hypothetical protein